MNDEERDRSGDGAGPSQSDDSGPYIRKSHFCFAYITLIFLSFSISSTNGAVRDAWARGVSLSLYETILPSSTSAVEQRAVEVSMSMILDMVYDLNSNDLRYGNMV